MSGTEKIKVMVVDDHPLMRVGVASIVNARSDMTVVAQTGTGEEAVTLLHQHKPDVTLMDLRLPGMSGVDAILALRSFDRRILRLASSYSQLTREMRTFITRLKRAQQEVLQLLVAGKSNKEIANFLGITEATAVVTALQRCLVHLGEVWKGKSDL